MMSLIKTGTKSFCLRLLIHSNRHSFDITFETSFVDSQEIVINGAFKR
jgi:hypothetical protein